MPSAEELAAAELAKFKAAEVATTVTTRPAPCPFTFTLSYEARLILNILHLVVVGSEACGRARREGEASR